MRRSQRCRKWSKGRSRQREQRVQRPWGCEASGLLEALEGTRYPEPGGGASREVLIGRQVRAERILRSPGNGDGNLSRMMVVG